MEQLSQSQEMLLRTSATPVGQTLLFESPNRDTDINSNKKYLHFNDHRSANVSFIQDLHHQLHLSSISCNSSPAYFSACGSSEFYPKSARKVFRRAQSDSNLEKIASSSFDLEELYNSKVLGRSQDKQPNSMLHTEPSFSIYSSNDGVEENNENQNLEGLERAVTIGESIGGLGSPQFSFTRIAGMALIEEGENENNEEGMRGTLNEFKALGIEGEAVNPRPAAGLGIDGGGDYRQSRFDENGDVEEYYKGMIREDPSNSLFLRNYAQFLQSKGDFSGAEDYYYCATLADPNDGEILHQYAKLVWNVHHDKDKAAIYFERAARAAPGDSHVHAANASFLWEADEDEDEEDESPNKNVEDYGGQVDHHNSNFVEVERPASPPLHLAAGLGIDIVGFGSGIANCNYVTDYCEVSNMEEYYKMMVEENPSNPLFLRNYAKFLCEIKGDLWTAEEFYSRAILADPGDGEMLLQYAKLIWQLHNDRLKALSYFEQAIQAAPGDSNVLAAYARFLWESGEDIEEEDSLWKDQNHVVVPQGASVNAN